jgi:hypothetical protein
MPKLEAAFAGAFALLLLTACGCREVAEPDNSAAAAGNEAPAASIAAEPGGAGAVNVAGDPVPPPDAVSHPNGFLPPAPAEPGADSSGTRASPPATEDQHIRNRQ